MKDRNGRSAVWSGGTDRDGDSRQGYPSFREEIIGQVTTGCSRYIFEKAVALALVASDKAKIGTEITVEIRKKRYRGLIRDKKFLLKNYKK